MKDLQRHAVAAVSLFALIAGSPAMSAGQRGGQVPGADVPRIMVATFRSDNRALGVQASDEVRSRIMAEVSNKQLWVISKNDLENTLKASGYPPDSALAPTDLRELAKLVRADEILDGVVTKTANGVRIEPRLMLARDVSLAQPLGSVDARDPGGAAKQIERELADARKQLSNNRKCENALRAGNFAEAVADANAAIKSYPQATLARLCLMTAYSDLKYPPDSIIGVTNAILQIDPRSRLALINAADAYKAKGDTAKAIATSIALYRADPSNTQLIQSIVNDVASMGKPDVALPLIADIMKDNPGDPQLLRTRWLLLLAAKRYKDALVAADEYAKADTSALTADFFTRQVAAASADSQPQVASQIAARAVQKYPNNAELWALDAQMLRKAGQLQQAVAAARRASQIDPKNQEAWLMVAVTQNDLNQPDSVLATARAAIAAGSDKSQFGNIILSQANAAFKVANASKKADDWERTLKLAATSDTLNGTPTAKFFQGIASFSLGIEALQAAQKQKSCADARKAQDMFVITSTTMPAGGAVDAATAKTVLGYVQQYGDAPPKMIKAFCK